MFSKRGRRDKNQRFFQSNFFAKNRRGLSTIVSTLLILLLVFVAIGILWVVVRNVIQGGAEQVSLGKFTLDLSIEKVTVEGNIINVKIKRNPGEGDFTGLSFILDDGSNTEIVEVRNLSMGQYSEKTFPIQVPAGMIAGNVKKIEVAPIFTLSSGKEVVGDVKAEWNKPASTSGGGTITPNCNNGVMNTGEQCDLTNLNSGTCASVLGDSLATGVLSCTSTCTYNTSLCTLPSCGNNQLDTNEECDGTNLNSGTCSSVLGVTATGTLACNPTSCQYDTSGCTASPVCGNSVKEGSEGCDDGNTASSDGCSSTCTVESGYTCTENVAGLSTCTQTQLCGNGNIDGAEQCDLTNLNSGTCASVMGTGYTGTLSCSSSCTYVTTSCVASAPAWQTGLVSWWNFDSDATDSIGSNDGSVFGGVTHVSSGCHHGGCYDFDGSDDYINVGTWSISGNKLTIAGWFNYESSTFTEADPRIIAKASGSAESDHQFLLGLNDITTTNAQARFRFTTDSGSITHQTSSVNANSGWHHLVGVYDGTTSTLYLDGVSIGSVSHSGNLITNSNSITIGKNPVGDGLGERHWNGKLDEIMVWNRALNSTEISQVYTYFN